MAILVPADMFATGNSSLPVPNPRAAPLKSAEIGKQIASAALRAGYAGKLPQSMELTSQERRLGLQVFKKES